MSSEVSVAEYRERVTAVTHRGVDESVVRAVLERVAGQSSVCWGDVENVISKEEWSVLVQEDIVEEVDGELRIVDCSALEEAIHSVEGSDEVFTLPFRGRVALGVIGVYFAAYISEDLRELLGGLFDIVFGILSPALPFYVVVIVLAVVTGVYSRGVRRRMDVEGFSVSKRERMRELNEKRLDAQVLDDDDELAVVQAEQEEVLQEEFGALREELQPLLWVFIGTMPVIIWLYWMVATGQVTGEQIVLPFVGVVDWNDRIVVFETWLVWYLLWSILATQVITRVERVLVNG